MNYKWIKTGEKKIANSEKLWKRSMHLIKTGAVRKSEYPAEFEEREEKNGQPCSQGPLSS